MTGTLSIPNLISMCKVVARCARLLPLDTTKSLVMPEHFHLLISEPQEVTPATVMQAVKLGFARRVLAQLRARRNSAQGSLFENVPRHVLQARFYDFNVWTARKRVEKLRYIHRNPVKRGLVESPEL
jgi:putative transposase